MSEEGEPGAHWSAPADYTSDNRPAERATAPAAPVTENPPAQEPAESVKSASVNSASGEAAPWERSLFDDGDGDGDGGGGREGSGDPGYAGYMPSGPSSPPKPGTPSSGNLRLPEWMRGEMSDGGNGASHPADKYEDEGRSRLMLFLGVGLLVVALLAAAVVYLLKTSGGDDIGGGPASNADGGGAQPAQPNVKLPADKPLMNFPGQHTRSAGLLPDRHSGLIYPRLGAPWQIPGRKSGLGRVGWSGQQVIVTERRGGRPTWYGQLFSGSLSAAQRNLYSGPGTERTAAVALARQLDARFYAFPHRTRGLASQRLSVGGHKGWLVGSYITYRRRDVKATGEVIVVAVVDTGRESPAVMFMAVPNTNRNRWPDINYVFRSLKIAA